MRKKKRGFNRQFVLLERRTLKSEEWRELSLSEKLIYIYLKMNYNGANNEKIPFKYKDCEFSSATVSKALKTLIKKEWIEKTKHGGLYRYYCLYKLTGKYDALK